MLSKCDMLDTPAWAMPAPSLGHAWTMDPIMIAPRIVGLFIELLRLGRLPLLVMENAKIVCG